MALVPQVVQAVSVPFIAAGGIGSSAGVQAALALGASAAQVGTAFLLCAESSTSAVHLAALKSELASHTAITNVFTGRPARAIINRAVREIGPMSASVPEFPLAVTAMFPLRAKMEERANIEFTPLWAGQYASACREITAADLVHELTTADRTVAV